jgi:hypothetical protein
MEQADAYCDRLDEKNEDYKQLELKTKAVEEKVYISD